MIAHLSVPYLGILGPKSRTKQLISDLEHEGLSLSSQLNLKLHSPIGLDIGADSSQEIALSIISEIQAVMNGCQGGFLKNCNRRHIHVRESLW